MTLSAPGQSWFDLILIIYAVLVMPALSTRNGRRLGRDPDAPLIPRYWRTMARGWLTVAVLVSGWFALGRPFALLGLDWPVGPAGLGGLLILAGATFGVVVIVLNIRLLVTPGRYPRIVAQMRRIKILPRTTPELFVFLGVSVTAGIWEELLYRGYLIWAFQPYGGWVFATVASGLVFGLGHLYQGWRGVLMTTTLGLAFAAGYALTQSLWWIIGCHALIDLYGGTLAWRVLRMPPPVAA